MYGVDYENPWLIGVDRANLRIPAWLAAVGSVVFATALLLFFKTFGADVVGGLARLFAAAPDGWSQAIAQGVLQSLVFAPFLGVAAFNMIIEGRRIRGPGGRSPAWFAVGLAIGAAGFLASVAIAWTAGAVETGAAVALSPVALSALFGLGVVGLQAVAEEAFFRAWLQPVLCVQWGPWLGLLATAILFAGLHLIAGAGGALAVANLFLGGLLFGLLALRSGGLAAPAAAHFAWNWTESGGLGLAAAPTGGLFNLHLRGAALWSGGGDTMNGSLATSVVLVALVAGAVVAGRSRRREGGMGSDGIA